MKKMKITLHKDGSQKIEVLGAAGDGCLEFTQEMERRLGEMEGAREFKPEYEKAESVVEHMHEAGS